MEGQVSPEWTNAEVILLFKEGDRVDISNYRPISQLSHLYKILLKSSLKGSLTNLMHINQMSRLALEKVLVLWTRYKL